MENNNTTPPPTNNIFVTSPTTVPTPSTPTAAFAKLFPDISKIEVFGGQNFRRWQERVFSVLDMHGIAATLTDSMPVDPNQLDKWTRANKVCRHTILNTLSNELFDGYCIEARAIWESINLKYTAKDAGKQKFVIGNYYRWEMSEDKDIKAQINEYHKLIEDLKAENISLPDEFVARVLIEKLPES